MKKIIHNSFATALVLLLMNSCTYNETVAVFPDAKCRCENDNEGFSFSRNCDKEIVKENGITKEHYSMYDKKDTISGFWYLVNDTLFFEDETGIYPFLFYSRKSKDSTIVHGKVGSKPTNYLILIDTITCFSNDTIYSIVHILNPFINVDIACSDKSMNTLSFDDFSSCYFYEISSRRGIISYKRTYSKQLRRNELESYYRAPYLK